MHREALICAFVAFLVYVNIIDGDFVYDDVRAVVRNGDVVNSEKSRWFGLFANDYWGTPLAHSGSHQSYRPVTVLTFRLNYLMWGLDASKFHLINLLLHALATYLLCDVARRICHFRPNRVLVTGLLFAVHPVHTEAVSSIVGRADILAALFCFSALLCYDKAITGEGLTTLSTTTGENTTEKRKTDGRQPKRGKQNKRHNHVTSQQVRKRRSKKERKGRPVTAKGIEKKLIVETALPDNVKESWMTREEATSSDTSSVCSCTSISSSSDDLTVSLHLIDDDDNTQLRNFVHECRRRTDKTSPPILPPKRRALQIPWLACAHFSALLSLLSKEQGFCALPICLVYDLLSRSHLGPRALISLFIRPEKESSEEQRRMRSRSAQTILFTILLIAARLLLPLLLRGAHSWSPPRFAASDNPTAAEGSLLARALTFNYLLARHLLLLLLPHPLCHDWSMDAVPLLRSLADPRNLLTLTTHAALLALLASLAAAFRRFDGARPDETSRHVTDNVAEKTRKEQATDFDSVLFVAASILLLSLLPATNLLFYVGFVIAERVLYLASAGSCIIVALLLVRHPVAATAASERRAKNKRSSSSYTTLIVISLLLFLAARTWERNWDWRSERALYESGLAINPAKSWASLGNVYKTDGQLDRAEQAYKQALVHRPAMSDTHYNLGLLYYEQRRYGEAEGCYRRAILYRPHMALAHLNLGVVLGAQGRRAEAQQCYVNVTQSSDDGSRDLASHTHARISAHYNVANLLADEGRHAEAIGHYERAIGISAASAVAAYDSLNKIYNMLGQSYQATGELTRAEHAFSTSLRHDPSHPNTYLIMARLANQQGRHERADQLFDVARRLDPRNPSIYLHYSDDLLRRGDEDGALRLIEQALATPSGSGDYDLNYRAATAFRKAKKYAEAEKRYLACVDIDSANPSAHSNLGAFLHLTGKLEAAERSYRRALALLSPAAADRHLVDENLGKLRRQRAEEIEATRRRKVNL